MPAGARRAVMLLVLAVCTPAFAAGCGGSASGQPAGEKTLTVFAASSLSDAFGEIAGDFERENPGVEVRLNFAGSSTLAAQIRQGAPADVFASADGPQMHSVRSTGFTRTEPVTFATNREVVIVPESNPAGIENFGDLSQPGTRLVLAQEEVPAAEYAEEIVSRAAGEPEYGESFQRSVQGNVVSREADVRAAVGRVATGDADATFGYASDVTPEIRDDVRVVEIPPGLNVPASYPIATLESSESPALARKWVEFTISEKGQDSLDSWGFETVDG
ncbi:molybdate ABC transporter substrate-binding protein [Rubrobacter aplysinae]|uniref:molybdate ABC transporter substrate-binding protein n=1 Tax=Rubrobacter aplysinae TaxID=909625 RepID=UPI000A90E275|nr:molybdate ABC transporter substrate-binding protein [Rubrobacter aplysinae]